MHIYEALVFIVTAATVYSAPSQQNVENTHNNNTESKPDLEDSSSSEEYLSNDAVKVYRRKNKESSEENGFEGYLFDETICKIIENRILCGYDRNKVEYIENEVVNFGNGCFIRNDRLECGYLTKEKTGYLRLKSFTEINTPKREDINIPEEATTTMLPTTLPVSDTFETTTNLLNTNSPESTTGTEQVEISSDTILSTTLIKPVSSDNPSTAATIKEFDTTIPSTSTFLSSVADFTTNNIEVAKNDTDLENQSKVENTDIPLLHKLKRSIEQTREEKASSCSGCPLRVSETDTTTFSPADTPAAVHSSGANMNRKKYLRYASDTASTNTACVEKDDRIVCYNYKAI